MVIIMKLLDKFIKYAIGNGIVLILGLISSPIITRIISPSEMGKYSMFTTVIGMLLSVVLLGIDQAFVRFYYEEEEGISKLLKRCIILPIIFSLIIFILMIPFYKEISLYIVGEESLIFIIILGVYMIVSVLNRFALLHIRMKQRVNLYSLINILLKLFYLILVGIIYICFKDNYNTVVLATVISMIIVTTIAVLSEKKVWFKIENKNYNLRTSYKEMIVYSLPFIFSTAITWIFQSIDRIMLKQFSNYKEIGIYSGAMTIIALLNAFQGAFTTFWVPVAYEKYNEFPEDKEFFERVNKIVVVIMLTIALLLISFKDLLAFLLGNQYRESIFVFPFLVFMPIMYTISETTVMGINFKRKTKSHIYISMIAALTNIIGNYLLVPIYGAKGAAISTGISYIIFFIIRTKLSMRYYYVNYNLKKFLISSLLLYIFAIYSSFNSFNLIILMMSILFEGIIILLYKEIIIDGIRYIVKIFKEKFN